MRLIKTIRQRYRYSFILLRQLVKTDFKLRYQGSVLGYIWSLLRPMFMFAILYVVFGVFLKARANIPHYPDYLLLGILLWNFFSEVTSGSVGAIVGKGDLMRKISFPKYVVILAVSISAFINLLLNFVVFAVVMALTHVSVGWNVLLILPLMVELSLVSIGMAFILSSLYVKFRDIVYVWEVLLQIGFYATPILYALSYVDNASHAAAKLMLLNPLAQIIQDARSVVVSPVSQTIADYWGGDRWIWGIPIFIVFAVLALGAWYFKRRSKFFAEEA